MTRQKLICFSLVIFSLCACGSTTKTGDGSTAGANSSSDASQVPPTPTELDRQRAQQKLEHMLAIKHKQQSEEEQKAQVEEEKRAAAEAEAAKPHYDPERLRIAASWRQWADITVPDLNIHAWLKSNWKNGVMHIRLALIGEKAALRLFTGSWKYLKIYFANQNGDNLHSATLSTTDLHWDDGLRNSGEPTMDFEGDSEVTLEIYEQIVQWNLKWDNE